jgi:hypothetical protein
LLSSRLSAKGARGQLSQLVESGQILGLKGHETKMAFPFGHGSYTYFHFGGE